MQILSGAASNRTKSFNDRLAAETEHRYVQISKQIFEDKGIPIRRVKCKVAGTTISHISCNERLRAAKKYTAVRVACEGCEHFKE